MLMAAGSRGQSQQFGRGLLGFHPVQPLQHARHYGRRAPETGHALRNAIFVDVQRVLKQGSAFRELTEG